MTIFIDNALQQFAAYFVLFLRVNNDKKVRLFIMSNVGFPVDRLILCSTCVKLPWHLQKELCTLQTVQHQRSWLSLQNSAQKGCYICCHLWMDFHDNTNSEPITDKRGDRAVTHCRIWVYAMELELHFLVMKGRQFREHSFRLLKPRTVFSLTIIGKPNS